jgi:hypothetical protein
MESTSARDLDRRLADLVRSEHLGRTFMAKFRKDRPAERDTS